MLSTWSLKKFIYKFSKAAQSFGLCITQKLIEDSFWRKGFLTLEKNKVMYTDGYHVAGKQFLSNRKGLGYPDGVPVINQLGRFKLLRYLPDILMDIYGVEGEEIFGIDPPKALKKISMLMDDKTNFYFTELREAKNCLEYSFDFETASGSHYLVYRNEMEKIVDYFTTNMDMLKRKYLC